MRVLLVDDEPAVRQSTRLLLEGYGCEVVTMDDAQRVLETLRDVLPALWIQDVRMPGLDLAGLVAQVRADPLVGSTPLLLFSAALDLHAMAVGLGAEAVLEKPLRSEDLETLVES